MFFSNVEPLLRKPLVVFQLREITHKLTCDHFITMMEAWPQLQKFEIFGEGIPADLSVLAHISRCHELASVGLQLDLAVLLEVLPTSLASPGFVHDTSSGLKELGMFRPANPPDTVEELVTLAQNLIGLFPNLESVTCSPDEPMRKGVGIIQGLVSGLKNSVAAGRRMSRKPV